MERLRTSDIECSIYELTKLGIARSFFVYKFHDTVNLRLAPVR
jgi:hypothetical protein